MVKKNIQITETLLQQITDHKSWQRGWAYYHEGRVRSLLIDQDKIIAKVIGSAPYKVELFFDDGRLQGECSCPMGDEGCFCKHCVAVGLAYLETNSAPIESKGENFKAKKSAGISLNDIREYLLSKNKEELTEILLEQVREDSRLRDRLCLQLAIHSKSGFDVTAYKEVIKNVTSAPEDGFVDYHNNYDYCKSIYEVVDSVRDLLKNKCAVEVKELTEYFIERCETATGYIDDSDGSMDDIRERLEEIHLEACERSRPDPEMLAQELFQLELHSQYDAFYGAAKIYSKLLGLKGAEVYRRLVMKEWDKLPALKPGDKEDYNSDRRRITRMMETMAEANQDFELMAAILKRDLSSPWQYLKLAELYKNHRNIDRAIEIAEQGLKAFGDSQDSRLEDFVIEEYHGSKRQDDVMRQVWEQLERNPTLSGYQKLNKYAVLYNRWDIWRQKAMEFIYGYLGNKIKANRKNQNRWYNSDHSLLVEIYLWEHKPQDAWGEAQAGGCSEGLWLRLAKEREKEHPNDAIYIYKKRVEVCVNQTNNDFYEEAVDWIGKIKKLIDKTTFHIYAVKLREQYKRKRNFVKLLDRL